MVHRHNDVCRVLYRELSITSGFKTVHHRDTIEHYKENTRFILYWDSHINTANKVRHDCPDIMLVDKLESKVYICEIGISWAFGEGGLNLMELRKYSKYARNSMLDENHELPYPPGNSLKFEVESLYKARAIVLPIVIGACGEVSYKLSEYMAELPLSRPIDIVMERLQRAAILGTHRIICRHFANK